MNKETGIWTLEEAKKKHSTDFLLAGAIGFYYEPAFVIDLGCGLGDYCRIFRSFGWSVFGVEGTVGIKSDTFCLFDGVDLSGKLPGYIRVLGRMGLVLCLEVGEHIPKNREQKFIDNVVSFCSKDLILSWAIPGQGGTGHFNEQPNEYIIEQIIDRGFIFDKKMSFNLRKHSSLKWFKNTIMCFKKGI